MCVDFRASVVMTVRFTIVYKLCVCIMLISFLYGDLFVQTTHTVSANTELDLLKNQINDKNERLQEIDAEIEKFKKAIEKTGTEKNTLKNTIYRLELERKKVQADISYTQNKIGAMDLEINKLSIEIKNTEKAIGLNRDAIVETLQSLHETDDDSIVEALLQYENLSEFWTQIDELDQIRKVMQNEINSLVSQKILLNDKHTQNKEKRADLIDLKEQYTDQNLVLAGTKSEKDELLKKTKEKEEIYQDLLADRQAEKKRFEDELRDLESRLQFILDPNTIPQKGTHVFSWPVDTVRITQYFGDTEFARSGAYKGNGHNGMDFGAPKGTPIKAALSGKVIAVNIDVAPMCQYGKWVLIRHANGLTTLYAHLSVVSVNTGDEVTTGKIVGYSGDTGYALGSHLHFTVYASTAVEFKQYTCLSGKTLTIPVSAFSGYLDPMWYLP